MSRMHLTAEQLEAIPKTTTIDVFGLLLISLAAGFLWFLLRRGSNFEIKDALSILRTSRYDQSTLESALDSTVQDVKAFNRSGIGFLNAWLPFLVLVLGCITCSFARDAGYMIFWWPMLAVHFCFGLALFCATWDRHRRIRQACRENPERVFNR